MYIVMNTGILFYPYSIHLFAGFCLLIKLAD